MSSPLPTRRVCPLCRALPVIIFSICFVLGHDNLMTSGSDSKSISNPNYHFESNCRQEVHKKKILSTENFSKNYELSNKKPQNACGKNVERWDFHHKKCVDCFETGLFISSESSFFNNYSVT